MHSDGLAVVFARKDTQDVFVCAREDVGGVEGFHYSFTKASSIDRPFHSSFIKHRQYHFASGISSLVR